MVSQGVMILLNPASCRFPRRVTAIYVPYIMFACPALSLLLFSPHTSHNSRRRTLFILFANFMIKSAKAAKAAKAVAKAESKKQ
jgi:hypothetical protein